MQNKLVIAFLGMPGAGKSEAINFIQDKYHYPKVYFGQVVFDELAKRKLDINENNERKIREDLRKKYGKEACAKLSLPKIITLLKTNKIVLIESLYSWQEYKALKEKFGDDLVCICIFANPRLRYERLKNRPRRPIKTYEEFLSRNYSQIENLEQGGPIAMADFIIVNESTHDNLKTKLLKIFKSITKE